MVRKNVVSIKGVGRFPAVYLLHGKGGSPDGTVKKLQSALEETLPKLKYVRPLLPHHDPGVPAARSVDFLSKADIPQKALLVGVSLGGLVAAKIQELARPDVTVVAISAPTFVDDVRLEQNARNRIALYSSSDGVIAGHTADWLKLAEAYDLPWLTHDTDAHLPALTTIVLTYMAGEDVAWEAREVEPRLGIFWLVDGRLIVDSTPVSQGEGYGDFKTHANSHYSYWSELYSTGAVPDSEYEEFPRGRVVYNTKNGDFTLMADRCILWDTAVIAKIMAQLKLNPEKTTLSPDSHYKCSKCPRGHGE
jgi:pimeloyl-ACP methyl ester carboxylesterase